MAMFIADNDVYKEIKTPQAKMDIAKRTQKQYLTSSSENEHHRSGNL